MALKLVILLILGTFVTAFQQQENVSVFGQVQFWQRSCDSAMRCQTPEALSDKLFISGKIKAPRHESEVTRFESIQAAGEYILEFVTYFKAAQQGHPDHLIHQHRLLRVGKDPTLISECSQYHPLPQATKVAFPVGICSGFLPQSNGGFLQIGLSFYR